ncbi:MAG: hypothetical protein NC397_02425 [Clostridium sp.]|nr:hypothetical protein [Clostridium sp.]
MDIKVICNEDNQRIKQIELAIKIANGVQNCYNYILEYEDLDEISELKIPLNWSMFKKSYVSDGIFRIYITERKFSDNWFSHEERDFAIITICDWEENFSPPALRCYLIYQIAQSSLNFSADINEEMEMRMVHNHSEGCLFDFCQHKPDIKLGMISGSICSNCRGTFKRYGVDEAVINAVEQLISFVRLETIGKPMLINFNQAFIVMRFTENDENDHAYKYGIVPALNDLGIDYYRADNEILSQQILSQVINSIEKSRYVIIKVDTDNLNVYFELGLAMGLGKEVLLISERGKISNLPTDLNNFECLTYYEGNYEELKRNIIQFFKDNYHY